MKKTVLLLPFLLAACTTLPTSSEYLLRGDGYFQDGKPQQALKAYDRALELNPDNLTATPRAARCISYRRL
jgi:tetratricopeptide (TPR) repeat protein